MKRLIVGCLFTLLMAPIPMRAAEILIVTNANWDQTVPPGKETDTILGDYVMKSDLIWAVIAQPEPWRNANMTVRKVGGCVIDLTTMAQPNDQLSAYYPTMRAFDFDKAEVVVRSGKKVVLKVSASKAKDGIRAEITYELEDGQPELVIKTRFTNTTDDKVKFELQDDLRADNFDDKAPNSVNEFFYVHDRYWRQAYGLVAENHSIKSRSDARRRSEMEFLAGDSEKNDLSIAPGKSYELVRRLIPGPHQLAVQGRAAQLLGKKCYPCKIRVAAESGEKIFNAHVTIRRNDERFGNGRCDENGLVEFSADAGSYEVTLKAPGIETMKKSLVLKDGPIELSFLAEVPAKIQASITGEDGRPIPCKAQFKGLNGTKNPDWGPDSARFAIRNLQYTPNGKFTAQILPGDYEAIISYGPEYDVVRVPVKVKAGAVTPLKAQLNRVIHSPGWVSADYHSHSSPSGDNTADQTGRVLNLLAEHVEFAPCTEHNRIDTYVPHLKALGAEHLMGTCSGMELTGSPGDLNHQNAFPLKLVPRIQDQGAPLTDVDPTKQIRRLFEWDSISEKLVQQNHPDIGWLFFDKNSDGKIDGGLAAGFPFMHVIEVHPIHQILDFRPFSDTVSRGRRTRQNIRIFNWLQLINQGHRIPGVVNTDAHYNFHGSGGLRIWVRCEEENPSKIDTMEIVRNSKAGRIIMSNGPYMEVKLNGKAGPGDDAVLAQGKGKLKVKVQCPNWLDVDRVQVLANGRPQPKLNFTRKQNPEMFKNGVVKFDEELDIQLEKDAHIIVVAVGENHEVGEVMGTRWGRQQPVVMNNPIYCDVEGDGFTDSKDTLDAPLPVKSGS